MTALSARLDELDALRAKATPGPWVQYDANDGMCWEDPADAALIVAAVNAVPQLVAALRAVEALCDTYERQGGYLRLEPIAADLRAALAAVTEADR